MIISGDIENLTPFFKAGLEERKLVLKEEGDLSLTVDSGFSGGIALPMEILSEMNVRLDFYDTFRLATGEIVELPVFSGRVLIGGREVQTWFIPGDYLLGMEFLSSVGSILILNFKSGKVELKQ
jgi:predicted aspartyl protease